MIGPRTGAGSNKLDKAIDIERPWRMHLGWMTVNMKAPLIFLLLFLAQSSAAAPTNYCSAPLMPHCITAYGTFDDDISFDMCRRTVERYVNDLDSYRSCLEDWVAEAVSEAKQVQATAVEEYSLAKDQYDRALNYWNCMAADPKNYCPSP